MENVMTKGFHEMSVNEMENVEGGGWIIVTLIVLGCVGCAGIGFWQAWCE